MSGSKIAIIALRLAFGGLFFYTGLIKLMNPINFLESVRGFRFFEHFSKLSSIEFDASPIEAWIAMGLPWLELICGATVLLGIFHRGGLVILGSLILVFITALISAWTRNLEISCGCFGSETIVTNYFLEVLLRLAMFAVAATLLFFAFREQRAS